MCGKLSTPFLEFLICTLCVYKQFKDEREVMKDKGYTMPQWINIYWNNGLLSTSECYGWLASRLAGQF